ncbi:Structural maintenance of chromosomes protein 4 [Apostasia shenzhenica]|uniref:Structural maintenance of chromosomes protein n=1 Tax=Apostasia shenzhenica TaxID=1088818 RepID=A0A2I0A6D4_9ASPA|nr:Structural maintenance of chromosomes protein 4 [Apostasia shenzhenica]
MGASPASGIEEESSGAATPRKARLFISEMTLRNFKSYAGEQRIGPFDKCFSAVVGPNGSGKSNVIDAMLFVFGKRAKQMRLNKVSELIHNSSNHQNLDSASVSVYFQEIIDLDDGSFEVVKGSEFVITRSAFRDNTSKYYINDRGSNFTEVTKKLKAKGVDLDNNRFLILQGEVEQISLMKPKAQGQHDEGFLEYLEDIIGTNQYVEKIEAAYKELEALNEKRSSAVQMVKLAEKEKDSLESVKNEAEAYVLKELTLLKSKETATRLATEDADAHVRELQENVSTLEENLKTERDKIQHNLKTLKDLESVYNKHLKTQEDLDNEMRICKDEFKKFERTDVKYQEDRSHLKQKLKKVEDKLKKDSSKIDEIKNDCEESSIIISKLEEEIPKLQQVLQCEEQTLEEIKERSNVETEKYVSELSEVRAELEPWENKLIEHQGKLDVARHESKLLIEKHAADRAAYEDAKVQLNDIHDKLQQKNKYITELQVKLDRNKDEASEARKLEQECIKQRDSLIPVEQAARQKVVEFEAILQSEQSQGSVLKEILRAKECKEIEGIYGRLGDLGAIDVKYDIAISTACSALDYILVDTTDAAQACVELLRKNKLGIATFMILEKQTNYSQKLQQKVSAPEGVPRLFDLVTVKDDRLKLAFYAALGNTVVAKDLDQATRIAYGEDKEFRRVVTLEGALFEKSGTMSGGGSKPRGGKMGTSIKMSVSSEAVNNAKKEHSQLENELKILRQKISDAIKCYQACEKDESRLQMELAKSQKEIDNFSAQHSYIEKQLGSLKAAAQPKANELNRLNELDDIISTEEKEVSTLCKFSSRLKDRATELQKKIEAAGGEALKNQKMKLSSIQSDLDKAGSEVNRCRVKIASGAKMIKKLTKSIEEMKKEKESLINEKRNMEVSFKQVEQKAFEVEENYKETQALIDTHKDVLNETKAEYNKLKKSLDDCRASEVDADYKLQDTKKLLKEWVTKVKIFKKKLDDLQVDLAKHMDQIQRDAVDPDQLQATLNDEALNNVCDLKRASEMVALLEAQLKLMNPNLDSIAEYRKKARVYIERVEGLNLATQERDDLKRHYDGLRKKRMDEFMAGFNIISLKLKEMYQMITLGGDAELELVDSLDPFSEGVVFSVRPPKKSWKNIANLSGGEKTLSSLALIFALHHYKPTPLYVMDEIDAALGTYCTFFCL